MEEFFGINYTFGKDQVQAKIDDMLLDRQKGYIIVADGVTLSMSHRNKDLKKVLDESGMTICDSGWVPLYLRFLYHIQREPYSGSDFLMDRVQAKKYKMMFLGSSNNTLQALKTRLSAIDERIASMPFVSLPFLDVSEFNYPEIAQQINEQDPDLIFVSLGMPKQEFFMYNLYPYLNRGILVGVGAAFKFHSGLANQKRAPKWMIRLKMEWIFRIFSEPKKQIKRCSLIISSMPCIFAKECKKRKKGKKKYGS